MFLIGFPLLVVPFAIYNMIAFLLPGVEWSHEIAAIRLMSAADWSLTPGDLLVAGAIVILFFEMLKSARLGDGGTEEEADVPAVAAIGVLEPHMTGIGGDCFCLVAKPGAPVWGYNGSGRSGAAARTETLIRQGIKEIDGD